jgi:hypothetical protein
MNLDLKLAVINSGADDRGERRTRGHPPHGQRSPAGV